MPINHSANGGKSRVEHGVEDSATETIIHSEKAPNV